MSASSTEYKDFTHRKYLAVSKTENIIKGIAVYRGNEYYILLENHPIKGSVKLVFKDGSKVFSINDLSRVEIVESYRIPKSINNLKAFTCFKKSAKNILGDFLQSPKAA
jgi:hypothetical protein